MKKINILSSCILCVILFFNSCSNSSIDGDATDTIHLSKSDIKFTKEASSTTVTTKSNFWWIVSAYVDEKELFVDSLNRDSLTDLIRQKEFQYKKDWFTIVRNNRDIIISVTENTTQIPRILEIHLQAGNWFGSRLKIEQDVLK